MRKNLLFLTALLMSGMILAQRGESIMKKYENQLPQAGRGNVHVAYQGKAIDQMIYEFMRRISVLQGRTRCGCLMTARAGCINIAV